MSFSEKLFETTSWIAEIKNVRAKDLTDEAISVFNLPTTEEEPAKAVAQPPKAPLHEAQSPDITPAVTRPATAEIQSPSTATSADSVFLNPEVQLAAVYQLYDDAAKQPVLDPSDASLLFPTQPDTQSSSERLAA